MSVLASSGLAPGSKSRTGPQLPDFLEISAPAKLQDSKRPNYMSEDSWVGVLWWTVRVSFCDDLTSKGGLSEPSVNDFN